MNFVSGIRLICKRLLHFVDGTRNNSFPLKLKDLSEIVNCNIKQCMRWLFSDVVLFPFSLKKYYAFS
jgi:hypothetical protein